MGRNERRREARTQALHPESISVVVRQAAGNATQDVSAALCDISRGGARLRLSQPLKLDEEALLLLNSEELGLDVSLAARMCWVCEEAGAWSLGVEFNPRMPHSVLEKLLAEGVVERRSNRRQERRVAVTARWESDPTDHPALLWDISPGGFCLLSPQKATRKVRITPDRQTELAVSGATQWEIRMSGGYVVGCQFIENNGFEMLQSLDPPPAVAEADALDGPQLPGGRMFRRLVDFFKRSPATAAS